MANKEQKKYTENRKKNQMSNNAFCSINLKIYHLKNNI